MEWRETTTQGSFFYKEIRKEINLLELIAVKLVVIQVFTKGKSIKTILLRIDNMTALAYLAKLEGPHSPELLQIAKKIAYLFTKQ